MTIEATPHTFTRGGILPDSIKLGGIYEDPSGQKFIVAAIQLGQSFMLSDVAPCEPEQDQDIWPAEIAVSFYAADDLVKERLIKSLRYSDEKVGVVLQKYHTDIGLAGSDAGRQVISDDPEFNLDLSAMRLVGSIIEDPPMLKNITDDLQLLWANPVGKAVQQADVSGVVYAQRLDLSFRYGRLVAEPSFELMPPETRQLHSEQINHAMTGARHRKPHAVPPHGQLVLSQYGREVSLAASVLEQVDPAPVHPSTAARRAMVLQALGAHSSAETNNVLQFRRLGS